MHTRFLLLSALLVGLSAAQTVPPSLNSVTNGDIVTLARAGFNEEFIVDFISTSRTRFDVTVNGLAELARSGLSERLIRTMLAAGTPSQNQSVQAVAMAPAAAAPVGEIQDESTPVRSRRMSEPALAMATQTPYYHSSTFLWGLVRKQVKISGSRQSQLFPQLGTAFSQVRLAAPVTMIPVQQGTRYVVIP